MVAFLPFLVPISHSLLFILAYHPYGELSPQSCKHWYYAVSNSADHLFVNRFTPISPVMSNRFRLFVFIVQLNLSEFTEQIIAAFTVQIDYHELQASVRRFVLVFKTRSFIHCRALYKEIYKSVLRSDSLFCFKRRFSVLL